MAPKSYKIVELASSDSEKPEQNIKINIPFISQSCKKSGNWSDYLSGGNVIKKTSTANSSVLESAIRRDRNILKANDLKTPGFYFLFDFMP